MDKIEPLDEIVTDTDDDFSLDKITNKEFKKFNTQRSNYNIVFKNTPDNFLESIEYLTNVMEKLVIKLKGDHKDYDRMSIHMDHPELENPINIPFMKINEITGEMIMNTISK